MNQANCVNRLKLNNEEVYKMVKIGGVSIDVSHPKTFATFFETSCMDMKYEYLAKESFRDDAQADWFVNRFGLKGRLENIADMVEKVDIGFVQSCNWEKHLDQAMFFVEKGKPVFIDKPIVGSVRDIERLRKLVADGAKIYGHSSMRYCREIVDFLNIPVEERGEIVTIFGCCGIDEFNYSIHLLEGFSALAQSKAVSAKFLGESKGLEGKNAEIYSVDFENGVKGVYQFIKGPWYPFSFTVMTTKNTYVLNVQTFELYAPMLREIYKQVTKGESKLADVEMLINCTQAMLCGKKSKEVYDGAEVTVDMLDENDKFDGYAFEAEYGANAGAIYKD